MEENQYPKPFVVPRPEHCLSRKNIDPDALKVMVRLHRHGFKAYLVGGSVRDLLLGRQPKDFDVSTDARPGQIRRLFSNCRIIGRRFRLAHVYFRGNKTIEVSTFRKAPAEPGPEEEAAGNEEQRRVDNTFGRPYEDAVRRDLTINGLFYDIGTFSILDYVGGIDDLKAGIIRTIGPPDERFLEDPIRMLRVVRHAVRTGFRIEAETHSAVVRNAHLLGESNRFRLQDEYQKDLEGPSFGSVVRLQSDLGLLAVIFPDLNAYLGQGASKPQALFEPAWVWKALSCLDGSTDSKDAIKEYRILSLVLPLIEAKVTKLYSSIADARKDPTGLRVFFEELRTPFPIRRREREKFRIDLIAWSRLIEFVEVVRRIPPGFRKKAHFNRVLQWYGFYQGVCGKPQEDIRQRADDAIQVGQTRQGRPRRKRKKRLKYPGKPIDFS
jgi:poly(A) polymerase